MLVLRHAVGSLAVLLPCPPPAGFRRKLVRDLAHTFATPIAVLTVAGAALLPTALSAECHSPDKPETVVARWDGGSLTVGDLCANIHATIAAPRKLATFASYEGMYENVTKQMAVRNILLAEAAKAKLAESPEWKPALKLLEEQALAEVMQDAEAWNEITVTDDEAVDFLMHNTQDIGEKGSFIAPAPVPMIQGRFWARMLKSEPAQAELIKAALAKYPVKVEDTPLKADSDVVETALTCGTFTLTQADIAALGRLYKRTLPSCSFIQNIPIYNAETLSLAQLARSKDYADSNDGKAALESYRVKLRDDTLAEITRQRLLEQWLDSYTPPEADIKAYYDNEWTGMEDPLLQYDALVVPVRAEPGATETQRNQARDAAKQKARMLIEDVARGKSFAELKAADADLQMMLGERRTVREETPLFGAIAQVAEGGVLAEPYEDFGGFCVMKVRSKAPRRKPPLQFVRGAIIGDLKFRYNRALHNDVNETILRRYRFSKDDNVLSRLRPAKGD